MKIVNEKYAPNKSEQMRMFVLEIKDKEKAAFFEEENEFKRFSQISREMGLKPKSRKLSSGGWQVWILSKLRKSCLG